MRRQQQLSPVTAPKANSPVPVVQLKTTVKSPTLARNQDASPIAVKSGVTLSNRKASQGSHPRLNKKRPEHHPAMFTCAIANINGQQMEVSGASAMINRRSHSNEDQFQIIRERIVKLQNEAVQASFEELNMGDYGNTRNDSYSLGKHLYESRSSVLIHPTNSGRADDSQHNVQLVNEAIANEENGSVGSHESLPMNTDINVARISIIRGKEQLESPQVLRKAVTNAQILKPSFKQTEGVKEQNSEALRLKLVSQDQTSPVIITSITQGNQGGVHLGHNSMLFDIRSSTPNSAVRKTPNIGDYEHNQSVSPERALVGALSRSETRQTPSVHENEDLNLVRLSSPVMQPVAQRKVTVDDRIESQSFQKTPKDIVTRGSFKGIVSMNMELFEPKSPSSVAKKSSAETQSPFRRSMHTKTSHAHLLAALHSLATQSEDPEVAVTESSSTPRGKRLQGHGTVLNEATRRLYLSALRQQEEFQQKKWRNMTPYERSKVVHTLLRMQRETRDLRIEDRQQPNLNTCLRVGEVKPGPNPFVRQAEKKFGALKKETSVMTDVLRFDLETMKDPKKIVQNILRQQQQDHKSTGLHQGAQGGASKRSLQGVTSLTESQMLYELEQAKNAQEFLIKEHPTLYEDGQSELTLKPVQSVLHSRNQLHQSSLSASIDLAEDSEQQSKVFLSGQSRQHQLYFGSRNSSDQNSTFRMSPKMLGNQSSLQVANISPAPIAPPSERTRSNEHSTEKIKVIQLENAPECSSFSRQGILQDLASVPEETSVFNSTYGGVLANKIKNFLKETETEQLEERHGQGAQPSENLTSMLMKVGETQDQKLKNMTQLSLQAISLTKKHQMATIQATHKQTGMQIQSPLSSRLCRFVSQLVSKSEQASQETRLNETDGRQPLEESRKPGVELKLHIVSQKLSSPSAQAAPSNRPYKSSGLGLQGEKHESSENPIDRPLESPSKLHERLRVQTTVVMPRREESVQKPQQTSQCGASSLSEQASQLTRLNEPKLTQKRLAARRQSKDIAHIMEASRMGTAKDEIGSTNQKKRSITQLMRIDLDVLVRGSHIEQPRKLIPVSSQAVDQFHQYSEQQSLLQRSGKAQEDSIVGLSVSKIDSETNNRVEQKLKSLPQTEQVGRLNDSGRQAHIKIENISGGAVEDQSVCTNKLQDFLTEEARQEASSLSKQSREVAGLHNNVRTSITFYNLNAKPQQKMEILRTVAKKIPSSMEVGSPERPLDDEVMLGERTAEPLPLSAFNSAESQALAANIFKGAVQIKSFSQARGEGHPQDKVACSKQQTTAQDFNETGVFADPGTRRTIGLAVTYADLTNSTTKEKHPLKQSFASTISVMGVAGAIGQSSAKVRGKLEGSLGRRHVKGRKGTHLSQAGSNIVQHRYSQSVANSHASVPSRNQDTSQQCTHSGEFALDEEPACARAPGMDTVFVDKRLPQGQKLFLRAELAHQKTTSIGFALSPLARRGQQLLSLGPSRRNLVQTKTPITKMLTASEMSDFYQVLGSSGSKPKVIKSPGTHFRAPLETRGIVLNQMPTARINADPNNGKVSKLELSVGRSGLESPLSNPLSPLFKEKQPSELKAQWQPLKANTVKPVFTVADDALTTSLVSISKGSSKNASPGRDQALRQSKTLQAGHYEIAGCDSRAQNKTSRKWQGNSMHSTRYLSDNASLDDYKMIGFKAVINTADTNSKKRLTQVNSVFSNEEKMKIPELKLDSNSQTDLQMNDASDQISLGQLDNHQSQEVSVKFANKVAQHLNSHTMIGNTESIKACRLEKPRSPSASPRSSKQHRDSRQSYISQSGQPIILALGVLPGYRKAVTKQQELVKQARSRYTNNKEEQLGKQRCNNTIAASSRVVSSVNSSQKKPQQPTQKNLSPYLFIDVKNWKQSVERHKEMISGEKHPNERLRTLQL